MTDPVLNELLEKLTAQVERLAAIMEKVVSLREQSAKCPNCRGDGKGYDGHRCLKCGGSGSKP